MKLLTLDFETAYGKHPETGENITLSKMTVEQYVRHPLFTIHGVGMKWGMERAFYIKGNARSTLCAIDWNDVALLCHNTMFDAFILHECFDIHPKLLLDTMSMAKALYPHESSSLAYLVEKLEIGQKGRELITVKDKWELTPREADTIAGYCALNRDSDVNLTYRLWNELKDDFPASELQAIDMTLKMFTNPQLVLCKDTLTQHLEDILFQKQERLAMVDEDLKSLRSNNKFAAILREHGVDPPMKISLTTGKPTYAFAKTDEGMQALLDHENEYVATLASVRLGVKSSIEETRTQMFLGIADRGVLPAAINIYGARNTLRYSGGDKQNLQNLPRGGELRKAIMAPPGYTLVVCDLSAIEARVLAWIACQESILEVFRRGEDVYCAFASEVFGYPVEKSNYFERFLGKVCILGLGYGMGWVKFAGFLASGPLGHDPILFDDEYLNMLGIPGIPQSDFFRKMAEDSTLKVTGVDRLVHCAVARHLVNTYRSKNTDITQYWEVADRLLQFMVERDTVRVGPIMAKGDRLYLPNGLSLHYRNIRIEKDKETGKSSYVYDGYRQKTYIYGAKLVENIVQALSRIIITQQMLDVQAAGIPVKLTVHDELVGLVPEDKGEEAYRTVEDIMCTSKDWYSTLPLDAEGAVNVRYGLAK
jgi:DNA polymerase